MSLPEYCQFSENINKMVHNHRNLLILQLKIFKDFRPRRYIALNLSPGLKDLKTFKLNIKEVLNVLTVFPCNLSAPSFTYGFTYKLGQYIIMKKRPRLYPDLGKA